MSLKLRQIEAFRAVLRWGSMVRAAQALSVTQPAISYQITSLERAIGFDLFNREKGRLTVTTEGHQFAAEVERLYDGLDGIDNAARLIRLHQRASIRILLTHALSGHHIVSIIGSFVADHPGIRIDIDVAARAGLVRSVAARHADVGITALPIESEEAVGIDLFNSRIVCVMAAQHPLAGLTAVTPQDLANVPIIALKANGLIRPLVDSWFIQAGIHPESRVEARDAWVAVELARAGVGLALVSELSVEDRSTQGLQVLPLNPPRDIRIGAVVPRSTGLERSVESLLEHIRQNLAGAVRP